MSKYLLKQKTLKDPYTAVRTKILMGMAQMAYMKKVHQVRLRYCKNSSHGSLPQRKVGRIGIKELKSICKPGKNNVGINIFKCSIEFI